MDHDSLTLSVLNLRIKESLTVSFPDHFWVTAEISEISTNSTGHCYLELIEKEEHGDRIIARMRATIWAYTYRMLKPYFENTTGYRLSAGIKIMVNAGVSFHEVYGISLNIKDIDPAYTLGDLARKRMEIINRLTSEGIIDMNKELEFPMVPQRIAVISSETAAGYGDFMNTLLTNSMGFGFLTTLFPAVMQGEKATASIISALEEIYEDEDHFDLVVLIRGGGAQSDLEGFNTYELAFNIAQFPLPVLTGIGHERDETIADMVAFYRLKTPTAVAEFLIDRLSEFLEYLRAAEQKTLDISQAVLRTEKERMTGMTRIFSLQVNAIISENKSYLAATNRQLSLSVSQYFNKTGSHLEQKSRLTFLFARNIMDRQKNELAYRIKELTKMTPAFLQIQKEKIERFGKLNQFLDPKHILKRGFSVTRSNGKALRHTGNLNEGGEIVTTLYSGQIISNIKTLINKPKDG